MEDGTEIKEDDQKRRMGCRKSKKVNSYHIEYFMYRDLEELD